MTSFWPDHQDVVIVISPWTVFRSKPRPAAEVVCIEYLTAPSRVRDSPTNFDPGPPKGTAL